MRISLGGHAGKVPAPWAAWRDMSTGIGEGTRTIGASASKRATAVWLLAVLRTLPWIAALQHLGALPAEAARQDLADGQMWPGLLPALIIGGIALGVTVISS